MADDNSGTNGDDNGTNGEAAGGANGEAAGGEVDYKAEAEKWKALSRKHEQQAKDNRDAASKLKELEDAGKTEAEKLKAAADQNEQRANAAEARALRLEIAAAKGLTPAQAKRLVGSTKEELEADADELLTTFKPADTEGSSSDTGGKPREALRGGATSSNGDEAEASIDEALKRIHSIS